MLSGWWVQCSEVLTCRSLVLISWLQVLVCWQKLLLRKSEVLPNADVEQRCYLGASSWEGQATIQIPKCTMSRATSCREHSANWRACAKLCLHYRFFWSTALCTRACVRKDRFAIFIIVLNSRIGRWKKSGCRHLHKPITVMDWGLKCTCIVHYTWAVRLIVTAVWPQGQPTYSCVCIRYMCMHSDVRGPWNASYSSRACQTSLSYTRWPVTITHGYFEMLEPVNVTWEMWGDWMRGNMFAEGLQESVFADKVRGRGFGM